MKKFLAVLLTALTVGFAGGVLAEDKPAAGPAVTAPAADSAAPAAAIAAPAAVESASATPALPEPNKGDSTFMYIATVLVIMMVIPGLALFYGGLVRPKNMLSGLVQGFVTFPPLIVLWVIFGYRGGLPRGHPVLRGLSQLFLLGV